jgi:hypothetical protein
MVLFAVFDATRFTLVHKTVFMSHRFGKLRDQFDLMTPVAFLFFRRILSPQTFFRPDFLIPFQPFLHALLALMIEPVFFVLIFRKCSKWFERMTRKTFFFIPNNLLSPQRNQEKSTQGNIL